MQSEAARPSFTREEAGMKKTIVVAAMAAGILLTLRRFGPALRVWAEAKCEEMMASRRADAATRTSEGDVASATPPSEVATAAGER